MSYFAIFVLRYGKWNLWRTAVPMDSKDPRGHITHALTELWIHSFDYVEGVQVDISRSEEIEDDDGHPVMEVDEEDGTKHLKTVMETTTYEWDGENFKEFIESFLSSKTKI